jgi:hypothetical protein
VTVPLVWAVFYKNCQQWKEIGFAWNQKNDTGRNMLAIVRSRGSARGIRSSCEDLARRDFLTVDELPDADGSPEQENPGGISSANRRDRSNPAAPGTQRHQRQMAEGIPEWQWNSVRARTHKSEVSDRPRPRRPARTIHPSQAVAGRPWAAALTVGAAKSAGRIAPQTLFQAGVGRCRRCRDHAS